MSWWEAALLGLVQGLTEFLPVSSSGHLVLGQYLLGITETGDITFEVFVHFGTVLSILTIYWRRVWDLLVATFHGIVRPSALRTHYGESEDFRIAMYILVTMIPTGLVYVLFEDTLEAAFDDPRLVCAMLLVTGTLLLLTLVRRNPGGDLTPLKAFLIGVAQSAAMIPGISRSGATICAALYQNVRPERAANFSFLMLLPVVIGATLLKAIELFETGVTLDWVPLIVGTAIAYVSGVAAIRAMIAFVSRGSLHYFAFYCYTIGILGLLFI